MNNYAMQSALWTVFYIAPRLQAPSGEISLGEAYGIAAVFAVIVAALLFFTLRKR